MHLHLPFRAINATCYSFIYTIMYWECFVGSRRIYAKEIETSPSRWIVRLTDWESTACLINDTVSPYREHTLRIVAKSLITRNARVSSTDEELTLARSNFLALVACPKCGVQWNKICDHEWVIQWRLYAQRRATGVRWSELFVKQKLSRVKLIGSVRVASVWLVKFVGRDGINQRDLVDPGIALFAILLETRWKTRNAGWLKILQLVTFVDLKLHVSFHQCLLKISQTTAIIIKQQNSTV